MTEVLRIKLQVFVTLVIQCAALFYFMGVVKTSLEKDIEYLRQHYKDLKHEIREYHPHG